MPAMALSRRQLTTALASSNPATAFDPYGLGRTTAATRALIFDADATFPTDGDLDTTRPDSMVRCSQCRVGK